MNFLQSILAAFSNPAAPKQEQPISSVFLLLKVALLAKQKSEGTLGSKNNEFTIDNLASKNYSEPCIRLLQSLCSVAAVDGKDWVTVDNIEPIRFHSKGFVKEGNKLSIRVTFDSFIPETKQLLDLLDQYRKDLFPAPDKAQGHETKFGPIISIWKPLPSSIALGTIDLLNSIAKLHLNTEIFAPVRTSANSDLTLIATSYDVYRDFYQAEIVPYITNQRGGGRVD